MARAVLFSRDDVSDFINNHFEPAWEMVRTVPIVRVDFGNGRTATRTLHGNVASYICCADGNIADIVPGMYTPAAYIAALTPMRALAETWASLTAAARLAPWRQYHRERADRLGNGQPGPNGQPNRIRDMGKQTIERGPERFVRPNQRMAEQLAAQLQPTARPRSAAELASWQPLVADTRLNETERRLQIHQRFATSDLVHPEQVKRWLYRDVLHADLDDPFMGLGDDFFANVETEQE
jgi:hypothetical protein